VGALQGHPALGHEELSVLGLDVIPTNSLQDYKALAEFVILDGQKDLGHAANGKAVENEVAAKRVRRGTGAVGGHAPLVSRNPKSPVNLLFCALLPTR
jgi:hypothetical protein